MAASRPARALAGFVLAVATSACKTPAAPSTQLLELGADEFEVCTGPRPFFGASSSAFDFAARDLHLSNAFWLGVLSAHAYGKRDIVLPELQRLGFTDSFFFDEDGVARDVLRTNIDFRWASTQGFWADADAGVVLGFRGTVPSEMGDLIADLWTSQQSLDVGEETVGQLDAATAGADAEMAAAAAATGVDASSIRIHKGFWHAVGIVWKHVETRAKALVAAERPKEKAAKMQRLDALAAALAQGDAAARAKAEAQSDWVIDGAGKVALLKQWRLVAGDAAKRAELFELIDSHWANWQKPVFVTGHSLGGALATVAAYRLLKLGVNVRGLYTYGSPRVGNTAFVHDFRVRAFRKGLKLRGKSGRSGEGGLQRFVDHNDVVTRIPPVFGWGASIDDAASSPFRDKWRHVSDTRYLTGVEASGQELWIKGEAAFDGRFDSGSIPEYTAQLPLESWKQWVGDHSMKVYVAKLEKLAFGTQTSCD